MIVSCCEFIPDDPDDPANPSGGLVDIHQEDRSNFVPIEERLKFM